MEARGHDQEIVSRCMEMGQCCLVGTHGFCEWKQLYAKAENKPAHAITMAGDLPMMMAGLWANWKNQANGEEVLSCTILTRRRNDEMAKLLIAH